MRAHHSTHRRAAVAASWAFALVVIGCDYDWEPREPDDAGSESDSSVEPVMRRDASVATDGALVGEASDTLDATPADAAPEPVPGDASGSQSTDASGGQSTDASGGQSTSDSDTGTETPSDAQAQDAVTPEASTCAAGQHMCGDRCVPNNALQSCGQSCSPCVPPANGVSSCDGTQCGFSCMSSYHACGTTCASDTDVATCGTRCTPCPTVPNGKAVCNQGSCGLTCNANFLFCGTSCGAKTYGFEDGTLSGATREDLNSTGATTQVLSSTTIRHGGSRALSIGFKAPDTNARNIKIWLPICPSGPGVSLTNAKVSMWVYVDGPLTLAGTLSFALRSSSATGFVDRMYQLPITPNTWIHLRGEVQPTWGPINAVGVYMYAYPDGASSWTGTLYFDDVTIE